MRTVVVIFTLSVALSTLVDSQAVVRNVYSEIGYLGSKTFLSLVDKAGLTKTLKDPRENLTVFAPTEVAFMEFSQSVMGNLENNATLLQQFVSFHMVKGLQTVHTPSVFTTLASRIARVDVYTFPNISTVSGSEVLLADNAASNGMVHMLRKVMYPLPPGTALTFASGNNFSMFFLALTKAGLTSLLKAPDITFFAPSDQAFQRLPAGEFAMLLDDIPMLTKVLQNHLVNGVMYFAYLKERGGDTLQSQSGKQLKVTVAGKGTILQVEDATVTSMDNNVNNGVVHVIDTVLMLDVISPRHHDNEQLSFHVV